MCLQNAGRLLSCRSPRPLPQNDQRHQRAAHMPRVVNPAVLSRLLDRSWVRVVIDAVSKASGSLRCSFRPVESGGDKHAAGDDQLARFMRQKDGTVKIMDSRVHPDGVRGSLSQCTEDRTGEDQDGLALTRPGRPYKGAVPFQPREPDKRQNVSMMAARSSQAQKSCGHAWS
jgi:hypothetical protein